MGSKLDRKDWWTVTSENAGMSNEKTSENLVRRKPKGS